MNSTWRFLPEGRMLQAVYRLWKSIVWLQASHTSRSAWILAQWGSDHAGKTGRFELPPKFRLPRV